MCVTKYSKNVIIMLGSLNTINNGVEQFKFQPFALNILITDLPFKNTKTLVQKN